MTWVVDEVWEPGAKIRSFVEVLRKDHAQLLGAEELGYVPW